MARHIWVNGADRWKDYVDAGTLTISSVLTYTMDTCSFMLKGAEPAWGSEVVIEDDYMGRLFKGNIQVVEGSRGDPIHTTRLWQVDCDDLTGVLNRRHITERYEGVNATEVFLDLATRYAPGFSVAGVEDCAEVIEYLDLVDALVADAFTAVAEYVGWQWSPDYAMGLHFFSLADAPPAPMILAPGGNFTDFTRSVDGQGVKNRILVRGGLGEGQAAISRSWTYVLDAVEWTLDSMPRRLDAVTVNGFPVRVGWDGVDDPANFDFLANPSSRSLKSCGSVSLYVGDTIAFTYYPEVPIVLVVDDTASQAAMAAVFGGDGVIEDVLVDSTLVTLEQAAAAGRAELLEWANPKVSVSFKTHTTGWASGQVVTVVLPDRDVLGDFIIQEAVLAIYTADDWQTTVTAGSTLFGLADFIADLSRTQKAQRPTEAVTLDKVQVAQDTLVLGDSVSAILTAVVAAQVGVSEVGLAEVA